MLVILRNLIQGWNGIVSHTTQSVMLRNIILVFNKVEKKSKREEMFNRMVNRNTKHRGEFMGFQESMEDVLDFIEEEIKRATSTQIVMSRKEFEDKLLDREREAQIEVLTEIFQTCYQEDSKTLELVEEKLSKLTTK